MMFEKEVPFVSSRWQRFSMATSHILKQMGAGFAEDNKGQEHGSHADIVVALSGPVPDHVPSDWQA